MVTDPSHSLRMTFNVSLIMKPYRISSFRAEVRMLYEKTGRRLCDTERRIYYPGWRLNAFLTTSTDPSHSLRMTFYRPLSLRTGGRKRIFILFFCVIPPSQYPPSGFAGHLLINKEAYPIPILSVRIPFLNTAADPSRSFRMTFNIPCHYDALPYPVIQSGSKNAVWENRETAMWYGAKNLLPWITSYRLPSSR